MQPLNDQDWVRRLQAGDAMALDEVIAAYSRYVAAVAGGRAAGLLSQQDLEEAVADVFVSLWKNARTLRPEAPLKPWLAQVARNAARKKLRSLHAAPLELEEELFMTHADEATAPAEQAEQAHRLRRAIDGLGEPDRTLFLRHYYYYQTLADISREMGLNLSTVKSKLMRGRASLKAALTQKGAEYVS